MTCLTTWAMLCVLSAPTPEDAFRSGVRPTEPLSPEQQRTSFHLPPGFEIQLFAAEPDIQKPMNLAFDAAGRLWMTGSVEYPYAAAEGQGQDAIKLLADTDGDGRADKITTFVDGLNIPMGLYPYRDGVIAYSMPNIWFFRDTDGDGRADRREVLFGPLGIPRDTHGMQNAFRRGFDGWLYANHGFANDTTIPARDGSSIRLQSGNSYRMRLDGTRVEQFSWGQVNPFGSTFLPDGDIITADCHSKPLTLLLRGAYYSSFGKPHDGLGFAPDLLTHDHGSTAICGVAQLAGDHFPEEYRGRLLVGNVMTSRVHQDSLHYRGSSPRAKEQDDFLRSDDPWFRPVDLQLGPDGALYIADFYNRIIGHYEVPLDHPGRDKHRARIWRVVYRGKSPGRSAPLFRSLADADPAELIAALASSIPATRQLATDQLSDRVGESAVPALLEALRSNPSETTRVHALWTLQRMGRLTAESLLVATRDSSELVRIHSQRVLAETPNWQPAFVAAVTQGLDDLSPLVQRAAADAAGQQSHGLVRELLRTLRRTSPEDPFLRHGLRMALRNQLRDSDAWKLLAAMPFVEEERSLLAEIALGVPNEQAAEYLLPILKTAPIEEPRWESQIMHVAVHLPQPRVAELLAVARSRLESNAELQAKLLLQLNQRLSQRGISALPVLRDWGSELATRLLSTAEADGTDWSSHSAENPWGLEPRRSADGYSTNFLSSLPGGEQKTATLRSRSFVIPPRLTFFLCGHLGLPTGPAIERNYVQLRLVESNAVVAKTLAPRNDIAQRVDWDLSSHAGQSGYFEIVDQLDLTAYAWLAVARFDPPVVSVPATAPASQADRQVSAALIAVALKLTDLNEPLQRLLADAGMPWRVRQAAAHAILDEADRPLLAAMCRALTDPSVAESTREEIVGRIGQRPKERDDVLLVRIMQSSPARAQRQIAESLAGSAAGREALLQMVERGQAAGRLLQDPAIRSKLMAQGIPSHSQRLDALTASLPPVKAELQQLLDERRREFQNSTADSLRGQQLFAKHCAGCHQVRGQGTLIGPQLDGIGNRGAERVIEDILDPNRNVDASFHVSVLTLSNGRVVTGLARREEGDHLIFADAQGKEFAIRRAEIVQRGQTGTSLMPANVHELLQPAEFYDLVAYLLSLRANR